MLTQKSYGTSISLNKPLQKFAEIQVAGAGNFKAAIGSADSFDAMIMAWDEADKGNLLAYAASKALALLESDDECVQKETAKAVSDTAGGADYIKAVAGDDSLTQQIGHGILHKLVTSRTNLQMGTTPDGGVVRYPCDPSETQMKIAAFLAQDAKMGRA